MRTLILSLALWPFGLAAQDDYAQPPQRMWAVQDVSGTYGSIIQDEAFYSLGEWRAMLPGSRLLQGDVPPMNAWSYGYGAYAYPLFTVSAGLNLDGQRRPLSRYDRQLRVSLSYAPENEMNSSWERRRTGVFDTLVGQHTGQVFVIDTTWYERYSAFFYYSRLEVDASMLWRRRTATRWGWYTGAGISLGMIIGEDCYVDYRTGVRSSGYSFNPPLVDQVRARDSEMLRAPNGFSGAMRAVIGAEFRLGASHRFWSRLHLHYELQPILQYTQFAGTNLRSDMAWRSQLGIRALLR
ncbi:MAG: hypothetical protein JNM31_02200 [Flavobacteriales bacterium]|nr:hypothetical protein [Flavobacteriales bacterium]